ncbi:MAG: SDR family NAD(P)-dependent oxidoreductase, partial [Oscillospiraceae bacterium]|nr:SDR family NAD(P)-dependent oxidoreductase [Oscillospiraceae bacterium]
MAVALITGAARGIGAAIAIRLAKEGFDIAINDLSDEVLIKNGAETVAACAEYGVKVKTFGANVSDHSESQYLIKAVAASFGGVDVLVNNAGITRDGLLMRMTEENYDSVISVNQKSVFNTIKFVAPVMRKAGNGRIINISSVAGLYGNAGQINYSASKAAVIAMTKTASKELGDKGITVNAIAPG